MLFKNSLVALVATAAIATPGAAWAFTGVGGCYGLPEYYRALGALQGMASCYMSVEDARRIVRSYDGPSAAEQQAAPAPHSRYRHHSQQAQQP